MASFRFSGQIGNGHRMDIKGSEEQLMKIGNAIKGAWIKIIAAKEKYAMERRRGERYRAEGGGG